MTPEDLEKRLKKLEKKICCGGIKSFTEAERDALSPVAGKVIYNTTTNKLNFYNGTDWEVVTSL